MKRILAAASLALFALMMFPSAAAYTGSIQCVTGCGAGNVITLTGATGSATFEVYASNGPAGTSFSYFVCPSGTGCSSSSGSANGWSWTFPSSGTLGTCPSGGCEGAGYGSPSTLTLSLTAPTVVTTSNSVETLTIYACSQAGNEMKCGSEFTEVASLTVAGSSSGTLLQPPGVPQFPAAGMGFAVALGALGLLFIRSKRPLTK